MPLDQDFTAMTATMTRKTRWCWRKDLTEFRGLTEREQAGFLLVLSRKRLRLTRSVK
jgi:hypothetical protein